MKTKIEILKSLLALYLVLIILLISCNPFKSTKIIDGCEYIEASEVFGDRYQLIHKGNCRNHGQKDYPKDSLPVWYYRDDSNSKIQRSY